MAGEFISRDVHAYGRLCQRLPPTIKDGVLRHDVTYIRNNQLSREIGAAMATMRGGFWRLYKIAMRRTCFELKKSASYQVSHGWLRA